MDSIHAAHVNYVTFGCPKMFNCILKKEKEKRMHFLHTEKKKKKKKIMVYLKIPVGTYAHEDIT